MNNQAVGIIGLTFVLLLGGFAFPAMISSAQETQTEMMTVDETQKETVTSGLNITVDSLGQNDANVTLEDSETGETQSLLLNESETKGYALPGGEGNVTLRDATPNSAALNVTHSPTYGWGDAAKTVIDNLALILIMILFLVAAGITGVMIP